MLSKDRIGKFTASGIYKLFVEGKSGKNATRDTYIFEKAVEAVTNQPQGKFSNKHTDHGHLNEFEAIQSFKEVTGMNVEYLEQVYFPINEECGATPDAHVLDFSSIREASCDVKCPTTQFFQQKMLMINESKPEFQNSPREMFYQAQTQMMALGVKEHYLVRYLTNMDMDWDGNKIEYDLPLEVRLFYKKITAEFDVQKEILKRVEQAARERDQIIKILMAKLI